MRDANILFILTDQWRVDSLGYMGNSIVKTPNVDQLAKISHVFNNAHTVTPLCSPARSCLLTGLLPHQNGVVDNLQVGASTQKPLDENQSTWLKEAGKAGYNTGYFGKWHLGEWDAEKANVVFDTFSDELTVPENQLWARATQRGELVERIKNRRYRDYEVSENNHEGNKPPYYGFIKDGTKTSDFKAAQGAIKFLEESKDKPWCVTASFKAPHFPLVIPEPYYSMYDYRKMTLPPNLDDHFANKPWFQNRHWWPTMNTDFLSNEDWQKTIAAYYGMISYVDNLIGEVIKAAQLNSGGRPTICIFTADHGEMLGAHSRFDKGAYFYEEVMRVPLLVCEDLNSSRLCNYPMQTEYCSTADVAKTIFTAIGSKEGGGRDLLSLVKGTSKEEWKNEAFGFYYKYNGHSFEVRTITTPRYKYSYVPQDIDELYDLEKDPYEMYNRSDHPAYTDIKKDLKERLFEYMKQEKDYLLDNIDKIPSAGIITKEIL